MSLYLPLLRYVGAQEGQHVRASHGKRYQGYWRVVVDGISILYEALHHWKLVVLIGVRTHAPVKRCPSDILACM